MALHSPTFCAETRGASLYGVGSVPSFTFRQYVGALNGHGAGMSGRLGLCTNWDSRTNALSGSRSKNDMPAPGLCVGMLAAIEILGVVSLVDTVGTSLRENPSIPSLPNRMNPVC